MTSIGGAEQGLPGISQPLSQRLAVGQQLVATVLGATRHGLSVQIGHQTLDLDAPQKLASAKTLTLTPTAPGAPSGQAVDVTGIDGQVLNSPIRASLTGRAAAPRPAAAGAGESAIVQKGQIDVTARPVSEDGKIQGPAVSLRLQAGSLESSPASQPPPSSAASIQAAARSSTPSAPTAPVKTEAPLPPNPQVPVQQTTAARSAPTRPTDLPSSAPSASADVPTEQPAPIPNGRRPIAGLGSAPVTPSPSQSTAQQPTSSDPSNPSTAGRSTPSPHPTLGNEIDSLPRKAAALPAILAQRYESGLARAGAGSGPPPRQTLTEARQPTPLQGTVDAKVVARDGSGLVLLRAADRLFKVEQPLDLPVQAALQLTFTGMPSGADPLADGDSPLSKLIGLLEDIDQATRLAADTDGSPPSRQLPAADRQLAARFLGLLATTVGTASQDTSSAAAGSNTPSIEHGDHVKSLMRELGNQASEPLADGWKSVTLPLGPDPAQAVHLFHRDHDLDPDGQDAEGDVEGDEARRAVFDVSFSRLGRCQLDVLCQEQRFDLLVRSENALASDDQQEIQAIFTSACEIAGMSGEIGFRVGHFLDLPRSRAAATDLRT